MATEIADELDNASEPFIGQWNRLVSTSNWEKGRIIHEWRTALISVSAPVTEYSDEAWSQRVGTATGQHVGRLRRVYERFGDVREQYDGLYWSHFQAAVDWDDAEMWLEGALQNKWSVASMRKSRWEAIGAPPEQRPRDEDIIVSEIDEDVTQADVETPASVSAVESVATIEEPRSPAGPDFGDEDDDDDEGQSSRGEAGAEIYADDQSTVAFVRPFENLAEFPEDFSEAFDGFKVSILRHKSDGWQEIKRDDVLASLDALKEMVLAPSADEKPF